jgi:hypothetical protein
MRQMQQCRFQAEAIARRLVSATDAAACRVAWERRRPPCRCENRLVEPFSLVGRALFDLGRDLSQRRRRVRVRTHEAAFGGSNELCIMINVVNLGQRPIVVTHVWLGGATPLHINNPRRPLPRRLEPDEPWETWSPLSQFGSLLRTLDADQLLRCARVRLSTGRVIKARPNRDVPAVGAVPGAEP